MTLALWLGASYLLGAIPTSYLVARLAKGIDLRQVGSGNLGSTNLYRTLGWRYAIPVALVDIAKGAVPVLLFAPYAGGTLGIALLLGFAAIIGHVFSVFVRFKGGKGVATAAGVVLGLAPLPTLVAVAVWALLVRISGYVSLGSIVAAVILPIAVWVLNPELRSAIWLFVALGAFVVVTHRANIKRLLSGTENRFGKRAARAEGRP